MTRFLRCYMLLAVLLVWGVDVAFPLKSQPAPRPKREVQVGSFPRVHVPVREQKPADNCTELNPEKAHPDWFSCPLSEQRMREM